MRKITKHIITITVYMLIILYFLVSCNHRETGPNQNTICKNFEITLGNIVEQYFSINSKLPETDGQVEEVPVEDLISEGFLTFEDLQEVGTTCSGNGYVTKVGERFYYYNDISCGMCSVDNMYTEWSDWTDELPNFGDKRYQVMASILYNYGTSEEKWTEWSDWGEAVDKIKAPTLPVGVEVVNKETEEKKQYKSRNATYQWYKLSENIEYYNNGAQSETAPNGYERLSSSKTYSRTTKAYLIESELKQKENVKEGDQITETSGYRVKTPKYIYSYTTPSETVQTNICETSITKYKCYKTNTNQYQIPDISTDQSVALSTCKNQQPDYANTCTTYISTPASPGTQQYVGGTYKLDINGTILLEGYSRFCYGSLKFKSVSDEYECRIVSEEDLEARQEMRTMIKKLFSNYTASYNKCCPQGADCSGNVDNYTGERINSANLKSVRTITKCTLTSNNDGHYETVGATDTIYGYKYVSRNYDENTYYETCPSTYPNRDTSKNITECTKYKTEVIPGTTYYIKDVNGGVTANKKEAIYLTDAQYNQAKSKNSSLSTYTKIGTPLYDYESQSYTEGNCPSGKVCDTKTMYKAIIYKYKWFKKGTASKIKCNNGAYSATSPAAGCVKDETTTKWSEWSEFGDEEIKKTETNEVNIKTLIRYRMSYINSQDLVLKEWYPYLEFEEKTGKKIEELRQDKNIKVQEKYVYKYRILKVKF